MKNFEAYSEAGSGPSIESDRALRQIVSREEKVVFARRHGYDVRQMAGEGSGRLLVLIKRPDGTEVDRFDCSKENGSRILGISEAEVAEASAERPKPSSFVTSRGSVYSYLPDGRTQRFKKTTGELMEPQDSIVFIPTWDVLRSIAPGGKLPSRLSGIENQAQFDQFLLEYVQGKGLTTRIVDQDGKQMFSTKEARAAARVFLALIDKVEPGNSLTIPVSKEPAVGYKAYDETYTKADGDGNRAHTKHLGNEIIEIRYE